MGAGAAGSVLAAELSASGAQVLVIESGGPDNALTFTNPSIWFYNVGGPLDYHLPFTPLPQLNNRNFNMVRSAAWRRQQHQCHGVDVWHATGLRRVGGEGSQGLGLRRLDSVFKKQEEWEGGANGWRGFGGPIHVRRPKDFLPTAPAFIEASREMGMPILDDVNGPVRPASATNIAADGTRVGAFRASCVGRCRGRTVFSQNADFRLITDHLRQVASAFPYSVDVRIDTASGTVKVLFGTGEKRRTEEHDFKVPEDVADGIISTLLKNISPSEPDTGFQWSQTSSKHRLAKLKIDAEGKQAFTASGCPTFPCIRFAITA